MGTSGKASTTQFTVTFDCGMNTASLTNASFSFGGGAPAAAAVTSISWSSGNTVATVTVNFTLAAGNTVTLKHDGAQNSYGSFGPTADTTGTVS
jgi:hypothetical protein